MVSVAFSINTVNHWECPVGIVLSDYPMNMPSIHPHYALSGFNASSNLSINH